MSEQTRSEHDVGRLISFTDAVVAIAITLIVLPLVDSARSLATRPAADFLGENALNIWAAALSFLVIAAFWKDHHRLYKQVVGSTGLLVNTNLLWVAGIAFLPVPTVLVVDSPGHDPVATGLYIGTILVTQVAIRLQELVIVRQGLLPADARPTRSTLWADWITVGLTALALALTLAVPATGLWPLTFILLSWPLNLLARRGTPPEARRRRIL